jgi:glycosyltransferase involved in cell wall biosynthesis
VKALLDDESRRRQLGELGKERVARLFNWDNAAKETADVYSDAIEKQAHMKVG